METQAFMFSLICVWINGWVNNREAGDLRRHRAHYDVTVMWEAYSGLQQMDDHRSPLLALCEEKPPMTGWFRAQRPNAFGDLFSKVKSCWNELFANHVNTS